VWSEKNKIKHGGGANSKRVKEKKNELTLQGLQSGGGAEEKKGDQKGARA